MAGTPTLLLGAELHASQYGPLFELPAEILGLILNYMSPPNSSAILRVRATCKLLYAMTKKRVAELFFATKTILLTDELSLQALLGISAHPVLSKTVKRIEFSVGKIIDTIPKSSDQERLERFMKLAQPKDNATRSKLYLDSCLQLAATQDIFLGSECSLNLLQSSLSNFKAAGNIPSLFTNGLTAQAIFQGKRPTDGVGFARILDILTERGRQSSGYGFGVERSDHRALEFLYNAVRATEYPLTHFEFGSRELGASLIHDTILCGSHSFTNLKILKLTMEPAFITTEEREALMHGQGPVKRPLLDFANLLRAAESLEMLYLALSVTEQGIDVYNDDSSLLMFEMIVKEVNSTDEQRALRSIREFELGYFHWTAHGMLSFVGATRGTLQRLQIGFVPPEMDTTLTGPEWAERVLRAFGSRELTLEGSVFTDEDGHTDSDHDDHELGLESPDPE